MLSAILFPVYFSLVEVVYITCVMAIYCLFYVQVLRPSDCTVYQVHMEAERRAMPGDTNILAGSDFQEKIIYKVGSKVTDTTDNRFCHKN